LGYLAALLEARGHSVTIIDQQLSLEDDSATVRRVMESRPELVGFSCTTINFSRSVDLARSLRAELSDAFIVAGGIHPTLKPSETLATRVFDAVIRGEGEVPILSLVEALEGKDGNPGAGCRGLVFANQIEPVGSEMAVLDDLDMVWPSRKTLRVDEYENSGALIEGMPCHSMIQSRGCPWVCRFCAKPHYHKIYRVRNIQLVVDEMASLVEDYGARSICFREDNFTADKMRLLELTAAIKERFGDSLPWECESRADLDLSVLDQMVEAGCRGIWCGIETSQKRWQEFLGKALNVEKIRPFFNACEQRGIATGALFMFGFPNQHLDDVARDVDFALSLPLKWRYFQLLGLLPGNTLYPTFIQDNHVEWLTPEAGLSVFPGMTASEMIEMERDINTLLNPKP